MNRKSFKKAFQNKNSSKNYDPKKRYSNINCVGEMDHHLIDYSWSINFNHEFKHKPKPFTRPRFGQAISFISAGLRCRKHYQKCKGKGVQSFIDFFSP